MDADLEIKIRDRGNYLRPMAKIARVGAADWTVLAAGLSLMRFACRSAEDPQMPSPTGGTFASGGGASVGTGGAAAAAGGPPNWRY